MLGMDLCGLQLGKIQTLATTPFNTHPTGQTGPLLHQVALAAMRVVLRGTDPCGLRAGTVRPTNSSIHPMDQTGLTQHREEAMGGTGLPGTEPCGWQWDPTLPIPPTERIGHLYPVFFKVSESQLRGMERCGLRSEDSSTRLAMSNIPMMDQTGLRQRRVGIPALELELRGTELCGSQLDRASTLSSLLLPILIFDTHPMGQTGQFRQATHLVQALGELHHAQSSPT